MQTVRTNLTNAASTQYTNFDFNSMCLFNGVLLGAGSDGLFKICCSDSDNGTPIEAYFVPAKTSLGQANQKRIDQIYLGYTGDGSLDIEIFNEDDCAIGPYRATSVGSNYQRRRVTPGHGFYWSYGSLKISNVDGSYFSIDTLDLLLQLKTHGTN